MNTKIRTYIRAIIQEQLNTQKSIMAFNGTRSFIPFEKFDSSLIGSGIVSSGTKYGGFFFTTEKENAEFYTEWFVAKVNINNVFKNPLEDFTKRPVDVLKKATETNKNYYIENYLDGHMFSDIIVVPSKNINTIEILSWEFVGDEASLFEKYDETFGNGDEDENSYISQHMIEETLETIGIDINYLLKIPIFKKYFNLKNK